MLLGGQNSSTRPPPPSSSSSHSKAKPQDSSSQRKPLAAKSSFGNQGFSNNNSKNTSAKQNNWGEPSRPKSTSKPQGPPSSSAPSSSLPSAPHPGGGKSAFVSVVAQDSKPSSSKSSSNKQRNRDQQAPRVLAPRFLKQMQREMQEGRQKDIEKENQRRIQAQNLAKVTTHEHFFSQVAWTSVDYWSRACFAVGGGSLIWIGRECVAGSSGPISMFRENFSKKRYPCLEIFQKKSTKFLRFCDKNTPLENFENQTHS